MGAGLAVDEGDPRITRVGALLRRLLARRAAEPGQRAARRDEPRRAAPDRAGAGRAVHASASSAGCRCEPGITGWAQVKGRAALPWHERIELDLWYIEHWSLRLDLRILAETARLLLSGQGPLPRARRAAGARRPAAQALAADQRTVIAIGASAPPGCARRAAPRAAAGSAPAAREPEASSARARRAAARCAATTRR